DPSDRADLRALRVRDRGAGRLGAPPAARGGLGAHGRGRGDAPLQGALPDAPAPAHGQGARRLPGGLGEAPRGAALVLTMSRRAALPSLALLALLAPALAGCQEGVGSSPPPYQPETPAPVE